VRYFFLLTVFLVLLPAFSQRYNFVNYSLEEGLPQSQVSDICQDRFGYLWIGTETGLSRFDGIEFENYSTDDGLPDNEINKLFLDSENKLWIATPKGIAQYSKNGFIAYPFSQDLIQEYNVNDFAELNGVLYIAADEGMLRFSNDQFELMPIDSEAPNSIRAILNIEDTALFCATRNGLYQFNGRSFSIYEHEKLAGLNMSDIARRGDEMFISTYYSGLIALDLTSSAITTITTPVNRIRNIHVTKDAILCATKNGATEIGKNSLFHYNLQNGLIFENIRSVFIDREQNIWLGTDGKGLLKLTGKSIISYTKADGLSSDAVMSISQNRNGNFYFGTYDSGLTKWFVPADSLPSIVYADELKNSTVWATLVDHNQNCWVGSATGLDILDPNGNLVQNKLTGSILTKIRTILFLSDSIQLVGGSDGISMWNGQDLTPLYTELSLDVNKLISTKDYLYVASTTGLFRAKITSAMNDIELIELPENNVKSITVDNAENIWIGTNSNGVYVMTKGGKLYPFELDYNDTRSRTILGLITDESGDIWAATLNGVYQISYQLDDHYNFRINHFGYAEGLITLECNQNAIYEDRDHTIWVGTSEGLVQIDPKLNDDLFRFRKPELLITGVRLFMDDFDYSVYDFEENKESGVPLRITFPYNKNHLTFDFIGLHLKDPEGVKYQYRLRGAEESWSPVTTNRYATYSFIDHGEYDFEVRATNNSGEWSEISRMQVIILPPFWLTWWFILLSIVAGIGLLILFFQIRIRAIKQKQENEKLSFKNRLLFLEQQSLNASMNRHFIFNSLNSIQYFINSSNKLAANKYLTSFAKLIRKNLDSSQANNFIVTLKEEIERIELYLSLEKMRFEGKFEYKIDLDENIDTESIEIPSMILQPFVENSIIHGVLPVDRKGNIRIHIYLEFGFLVLELTDDGMGIDKSLTLKKTSKDSSHDSMGMEITSRRIDLIRKLTGENLMIIGPFQTNDDKGNSLGTKVIIKINIENQSEA
jgi:ligand-binding sensor domain-containing protein